MSDAATFTNCFERQDVGQTLLSTQINKSHFTTQALDRRQMPMTSKSALYEKSTTLSLKRRASELRRTLSIATPSFFSRGSLATEYSYSDLAVVLTLLDA